MAQDGSRYDYLDGLGRDELGEWHRVRDRELERTLVMRVLRTDLAAQEDAAGRFLDEARAAARLIHPGIVPVLELGRLADGRPWVTTPELPGRTLREVLTELYAASIGDRWEPTGDGWTFRKAVGALHQACEAVAYAHGQSVVHGRISAARVLVGGHGEVVVTGFGAVDARPGTSLETHACLAPEVVIGGLVGPATDVYGLGAVLYQLLDGRPPYVGEDAEAVRRAIRSGPPRPPARGRVPATSSTTMDLGDTVSLVDMSVDSLEPGPSGAPVPLELVELCVRAMARDPSARYSDARALAEALGTWLDGAQKREQALAIVERARDLPPHAERMRRQAARRRVQARALLKDVPTWAPETDKLEAWELEDEADRLIVQADLKELEARQLLRGALLHSPELPEAHELLAEHHRHRHAAAEAAHDDTAAWSASALLRTHASALPELDPARTRLLAYLRGQGALTLVTEPPGAKAELYRYDECHRRLLPEHQRSLGATPLSRVPLPRGSYLLLLTAPGRAEVAYPVRAGRQEAWDCVPPGASTPRPLFMPAADELGDGDVYVPAGWFAAGGDPEAPDSLPGGQVWVDGFVIRRTQVTNEEYLAFLNDLVERGRESEALKWAPRERSGTASQLGALVYGRDGDGRFVLQPDTEGDVWSLDWPVLMLDWDSASAYCRWLAERTGKPWRLPGELEWEKAARGVDGRFFPWGDRLDPSWCCMRDSHEGRPLPEAAEARPADESPYGVLGLAGNIADWCGDGYRRGGPVTHGRAPAPAWADPDAEPEELRVVRGGGWASDPRQCRAATRVRSGPDMRNYEVGFRPARSLG